MSQLSLIQKSSRSDTPRLRAKAGGQMVYNTGKACIHGHFSDRLVSNGICMECHSIASKKAHYKLQESQPELMMWRGARRRAKENNFQFTITVEDIVIPKYCPVLGIKLKTGKGTMLPESPSLDRIIPSLGYTPDNVEVISQRANRIKYNATPEELMLVAEYYRK